MITANVQDVVPRLKKLGQRLDHNISLGMDLWVHESGETLEWHVWDGKTHHHGATLEEAVRGAELAHGLLPPIIPDTIVVPDVPMP